MVHTLDDKREAVRQSLPRRVTPDADGSAPGHEPIPIVLDFVNPIGAGRRAVGGEDRQGSIERAGMRRAI